MIHNVIAPQKEIHAPYLWRSDINISYLFITRLLNSHIN